MQPGNPSTACQPSPTHLYPVYSFSETDCYKTHPKLVGSLKVTESEDIAGLAFADGLFVVVRLHTDSLWIFSGQAPFDRADDIRIDGMQNPSDLAYCEDTDRVYVVEANSDSDGGCIWRVWPRAGLADRLVTLNFKPSALSTAFGRIIVTPENEKKLFIISADDGQHLKQIEFPS
jgi:hypothetical protein